MAFEVTGLSPAVVELNRQIETAARTDARVLISGERGTEQDLVARYIHLLSTRSGAPYIGFDCGAGLPDAVVADSLGHLLSTRQAPPIAKQGVIETAAGGTLFLEAVDELSLSTQKLLVDFLRDGLVRPIGGDELSGSRPDVRVIAGTYRDLVSLVREGAFREDLYYRLNVMPLNVPPLRQRREDIPLLVSDILAHGKTSRGSGRPLTMSQLTAAQLDALRGYSWPGNVRQLRVVLEDLASGFDRDEESQDILRQLRQLGLDATVASAAGAQDSISGSADFEIRFPADCSPAELKTALTALADYYRACGGVGLRVECETEEAYVEELAHA